MTITKYKITKSRPGQIERLQVDRESASSVWLDGSRVAKVSAYTRFHDSWADAHAFLLADAERKVLSARRQLELANSLLGNIKGMKNREAA